MIMPGNHSDEYFSDLIQGEDAVEDDTVELTKQLTQEIESLDSVDDAKEGTYVIGAIYKSEHNDGEEDYDAAPDPTYREITALRSELAKLVEAQMQTSKRITAIGTQITSIFEIVSTPKPRGRPKGTTGIKKKAKTKMKAPPLRSPVGMKAKTKLKKKAKTITGSVAGKKAKSVAKKKPKK
jgi:hypothetical protein